MGTQQATFALGCFWGPEHYFNKKFKGAIVKSAVGYTGGKASGPSYERVCSGSTGHAEAIQLDFDPSKATYPDLVEYFFRIHDPTTVNKQGNDKGTQYRSAIFYHSPEQQQQAEAKRDELQKTRIKGKIVTEIVPAGEWWDAEAYHQKYLINNPGGYCNHRERW
ncbi:hypothetical protein WJX73_006103 [Symbiochloris irregularis]|uniref:peptide-methionine (S)-S-oxide reductase n=1 Tax=Symbiochloris irregularis TaxID=706552 RepID=A0AAW1PF48_9CHLO